MEENNSLDIVQNCWVVPDLQQAMQKWLSLGYGPFITATIDVPDAIYHGRVVPLNFSMALTQAGGLQVELIEQHSNGPSAYRDMYGPEESGFHHVCRIANDFDAEVEKLRQLGVKIATEAESSGMRFCYADTRETIGCMLELVPDVPLIRGLYSQVAAAATNWDGSDPIRGLNLILPP